MTKEKPKRVSIAISKAPEKEVCMAQNFLQSIFWIPPQSATDGDWRRFDSRSILFWKEAFLLLSFSPY